MFKYKLEDGQKSIDPLHQIIHKTGKETKKIDVQFTMAAIIKNIDQFKKVIREKTAQAQIHAAEMKNVELNHPELLNLDEKLMQAAYVHITARISKEAEEIVAKQYQTALDGLEEECKLIQSQIHFAAPFSIEDEVIEETHE